MAAVAKPQKSRKITSHIHHLGNRCRRKEVESEETDEQEEQEAACPRTEEPVVKPDPAAYQDRKELLPAPAVHRCMDLSKVLFLQGVQGDGDQDEWQQLAQEIRRHMGYRVSPQERKDK